MDKEDQEKRQRDEKPEPDEQPPLESDEEPGEDTVWKPGPVGPDTIDIESRLEEKSPPERRK